LSPADVALGYKQLLEVKAAFRTLKQTLDLEPVYHRLARRIEAHVLLCWLALLLIRVAETRVEEKLGQRLAKAKEWVKQNAPWHLRRSSWYSLVAH